jgi:hypothetical protein
MLSCHPFRLPWEERKLSHCQITLSSYICPSNQPLYAQIRSLILLAEVSPGLTALELQDTVQESGEDSGTGGLLTTPAVDPDTETAVTRAPPREISDVFVRVFFDKVHPSYPLFHRSMFQLRYEALYGAAEQLSRRKDPIRRLKLTKNTPQAN